MKDKFKEHNCDFKNEAECEEELDEENLDFEKEKRKHFDEDSEKEVEEKCD